MTERIVQDKNTIAFRVAPTHRWDDFVVAQSDQTAVSLQNPKYINRRDFLKLLLLFAGSTALAACAPKSSDGFPQVEAFSRPFPDPDKELKRVWGAAELENAWKQAVDEALNGDGRAELSLPEGEIYVDRKLNLEVPENVSIYVNGSSKRSRIKGSQEMSVHPESYGARNNNLLEIGVANGGYVSLDKVEFDGGSNRAGIGGYDAPPSPWNAIVAIYGRGVGDGLDNNGAQARGRAEIINCNFQKSEGPGLMVQNLEQFRVAGCTTQATDCLVTANWCQKGEIYKCYGKNVLSDFVFSVWSSDIVVHECGVNLAWAGYNFRSCKNIEVNNCYAGYCLAAVSTSEVIPGSNERTVGLTVNNLQTWGSSCVYAFQHADEVILSGGVHDNLGEVLNANNFMSRINNPEWVAEQPIYLGPNNGQIFAENLLFRRSDAAPSFYKLREELSGSTFIGFDDSK